MAHDRDCPPAEKPGELLARPLQYLKGVGPARALLLKRLQLETLQDLLFHFPVAHKDRASVTPIAKLKLGAEANLVAQIIDVRGRRFGGKEKIEALLKDESGELRAGWWNPWIADRLTPNGWGFFSGKLAMANNRIELSNSEFEILGDGEDEGAPRTASGPNFGRIVPVYNLRPKQRLPDGQEAPEIRMTQSFLRKTIWQGLAAGAAERLTDQLPEYLRRKLNLPGLAEAIRQFHFPDSFAQAALARRRLAFEELLIIALGVALRRAQVEKLSAPKRLPLAPAILKRITARLPFTLTPSQARTFQEIAADLASARPMNRLLQGDVASGKTAVAVASLLLCVAHGGQAALLAPTEVLAEQHARTLSAMLPNSRVKLGLLRGGSAQVYDCGAVPSPLVGEVKRERSERGVRGGGLPLTLPSPARGEGNSYGQAPGADSAQAPMRGAALSRAEFLDALALGGIHIAIGTHALLEPDVKFRDLSLIVVDEQHKFGVAQRLALRAKGRAPHVLVMTATPIPRTLTLTLYGDLDVSRIAEPPPGRGEAVTKWLKDSEREKVYRLISGEVRQGNAAYIVLPRIDAESYWDEGGQDAGSAGFQPANEGGQDGRAPVSGAAKAKTGRAPQRLWSEVKGVEAEVKRLRARLPALRIGMLHGRMASEEKDEVLARLREGRLDVLVSTQVIEVGIDLPKATVMVIENAELFGLAALHQLRGRVGRSGLKSYCFVFANPSTDEARERLKTFIATRDGFAIAEADFRLRGPGQFFGTPQSGLPELKVADLLSDTKILHEAREEAFALVKRDPELSRPEHGGLKQRVNQVLGQRLKLIDVG